MNLTMVGELSIDMLWSGVAATGFAVLFNLPKRFLPICCIVGAVSHGLRTGLMQSGLLGIEASTLVAAMVIGIASVSVARRRHLPVVAFALPSAIPMVPGAFAFKAMLGVLRLVSQAPTNDPQIAIATLTAAAKTALILAAMVMGVGSPSMLFRRSDAAELAEK